MPRRASRRSSHGLFAEQDVLGDREHGNQHEVLMDHVDPAGDRVRGTADVYFLAVQQDRAFVRPGQPVEDVHQRCLAGAVLAQQGMDLARTNVQIDVVVGGHARVALGDPAHFECRRPHRSVRGRHRGLGGGGADQNESGPV